MLILMFSLMFLFFKYFDEFLLISNLFTSGGAAGALRAPRGGRAQGHGEDHRAEGAESR